MNDYQSGVIFGALIVGALTGAVPAVVGAWKGRIGMGLLAFAACVIAALILGLLAAVPTMAVSVWLIVSRKNGEESAVTYRPLAADPVRSDAVPSPAAVSSATPASSAAPRSPGMKRCPDCAETVQAAAHICRFCRHEFPPDPPAKFGYWTVFAQNVNGLAFGDSVALSIDGDRLIAWKPGGDRIGAGWERGSVRVTTGEGRVFVYDGKEFLLSLLPADGDTDRLAEAFASYPDAPASFVQGGPGGPPQAAGGVVQLGRWEVVQSASEYIHWGASVSVNVNPRLVAVVGTSASASIPRKEAAAAIEGGRLCLTRGSVRQFELVPADGQGLDHAVAIING